MGKEGIKPRAFSLDRPASVRQIVATSVPLMLASFSDTVMLLVDRLVIAQNNAYELSAVVLPGSIAATLHFSMIAIVGIAVNLVSNAHGRGDNDAVADPVWQMLWFSLALIPFFMWFGWYGAEWFLPERYWAAGVPYFRLQVMFGWLWPSLMAVSAFFIGRGDTRTLMKVSLLCTFLNFILDLVFVFGWSSLNIPSWGAPGAALATVVSMVVQVVWLLALFLQSKYRKRYNSHIIRFNWPIIRECLAVGWPTSLSIFCEIMGWSVVGYVVAYKSDLHMAVYTVAHTYIVVLLFIPDGLTKAVQAISAYLLGRGRAVMHYRLLASCVRIQMVITVIIVGVLLLGGDFIIRLLLESSPHQWGNSAVLRHAAFMNMVFCSIYFLLDVWIWLAQGVLTAFRDTRFYLLVKVPGIWLGAIVPTAWWVSSSHNSLETMWLFMLGAPLVMLPIFMLRIRNILRRKLQLK